MEFWPSSSRVQDSTHRTRAKRPAHDHHPNVETGRLTAASLVEHEDGRFSWCYAFDAAAPERSWKLREAFTILPATRFLTATPPHSTIQQRAEQSANFLRTVLPEIDVTADLMRKQLSADERITRALKKFDPSAGNVLEIVMDETRQLLAYPTGQLGSDLNIASIPLDHNNHIYKLEVQCTKSFLTPILQLVSSSFDASRQANNLAVRTFGPTHILDIRRDHDREVAEIADVASLNKDETGRRSVIDMAFQAKSSGLIVVNNQGAVYLKEAHRRTPISIVNDSGLDHNQDDQFWRLAAGCSPEQGFLSSSKVVREYDLRTTNPTDIFKLTQSTEELFTSLEHPVKDYLMPLCTTGRIMWIDRRSPGKTLLAYQHRRQYDRTLHTCTIGDNHTMLLSRKNGLVTVYSLSPDALPHISGHPYVLMSGPDDTFVGDAFWPRTGENVGLFRISAEGRMILYDVSWSTSEIPCWSDGVHGLDDQSSLKPEVGPLEGREFSKVNLRPAYEHIFYMDSDLSDPETLENSDDILDNLSTFWQRADAPIKHVMITDDIIHSCGGESDNTSRSGFLAERDSVSTKGYRALLQKDFPWEKLRAHAQWHREIGHTLTEVPPLPTEDVRSGAESFNLSGPAEERAELRQRQTRAGEELSLDLVLSKDVFCHRSLSPLVSGLETMAGLSLGEGPPPVNFSFLQPRPRADLYSRDESDPQLEMPPGVRLLLKEWEIGADPEDAVFTDPYGDQELPKIPHKSKNTSLSPPPPSEHTGTQSQAPPMVMNSSTLPPTIQTTLKQFDPLRFHSQVPDRNLTLVESESQGLLTSTQALPGPFGSRTKKKPAKRRLGGF
ncbi:hypothetical protein L218DRAFT_957041 [Marasmius fiardii PR-910]|nr:hypothetical protein L218DRAFT_957041 [Marasmius fiardii PR-910]